MGGSPKIPKRIRPTNPDLEAERSRERERERLRLARGRESTILTGGVGDLSSPNLGRAVLTGQ
jgi:hypothetical protein